MGNNIAQAHSKKMRSLRPTPLEPSAALLDELVADMRGRMEEDDASVPVADGPWLYLDGKLTRKKNTFSDFIAAARMLAAEGYTLQGLIVAQGGSPSGMLMGVVANMAPHLFAGIIAAVPFVDKLATMLTRNCH